MSDCMPRVFDVTALVPVTLRFDAQDEAEAIDSFLKVKVALSIPHSIKSVGFPQEITVKEVDQNAST